MNRWLAGAVLLVAAALVAGTLVGGAPWAWTSLLPATLAGLAAAALVQGLRRPGAPAPPLRAALPRVAAITGGMLAAFVLAGQLPLVTAYAGHPLHLELAGLAFACTAGLLLLTVVTEERTT